MSDFDQPDPNARDAPMLDELERGREHYGRRAWADAYRSLAAADQASRLGARISSCWRWRRIWSVGTTTI